MRGRRLRPLVLGAAILALLISNLKSIPDSSEVEFLSYTFPTDHRGTWIGTTWIPPPGWRLYSIREIQSFYANTSFLWLGDSTARRAAATLYSIFETATPHASKAVINRPDKLDVNKNRTTEVCEKYLNVSFCWPLPMNPKTKDFINAGHGRCLTEIVEFLQRPHLPKVDLLIVATGLWDFMRTDACHSTNETLIEALELLGKLQSSEMRVVWRTCGYPWDEEYTSQIDDLNHRAMTWIDRFRKENPRARLSYVDWGGAMKPRSFGGDRIRGDIKAHYGLEARVVFAQMLTNHLKEELDREGWGAG